MKAITTLSRLIFVKNPEDKISSAITLVYPPEWLDAKPVAPENAHFKTNREMSISVALARLERSRPQTLGGNLGQMAACLRHYVSDQRLLRIKEKKIPVLVITGTYDNLVNPKNSYHLSEVLGCKIHVFEGSGHGLPSEQSVAYNNLLDEHFSNAAKSRIDQH